MKVETIDYLLDVFSYSKLMALSRCPAYAFLKYVKRLRQPSERVLYPLIAGRAIHAGQETDAYSKLRGEALSVGQVLESAVTEFEAEREKEGVKDPDAPKDKFVTEHLAQLEVFEKSGERAKICPMPGSIEAPYRVHLEIPGQAKATLEGYTDLVSINEESDRETVEYKSGARAITEKEAANNVQLALEALGAEARYTKIVNFVAGKRQHPTTKVTPPVEATRERVELALQWVNESISEFRAAVKSGSFPRCSPGSWWCSVKACEYFSVCFPKVEKLQPVVVTRIEPVGTLPPVEWRKSLAGKKQDERDREKA